MPDELDGDIRRPTKLPNLNTMVEAYLLTHIPEYKELLELKRKGWENREADQHFKQQRYRADHADDKGKRIFYEMMRQIGDELHNYISAPLLLARTGSRPSVLDICMAPGGFTASVLKRHPIAKVCAISLPLTQGGHEILLPNWQTDPRIQVHLLDITMLAAEMDAAEISAQHPDAANFLLHRPFQGQEFDLIFCDGQVLRSHPRAQYREKREASRLLASQLVLAMQRVRQDGKIVMMLHKIDASDTVALLYTFSKFSSLRLFKPKKKHSIRSSFYLIAEEIQPQSIEALCAVAAWKKEWYIATCGSDKEHTENLIVQEKDMDYILSEFGQQLISLAQPVCSIQCDALRRASFVS